jgi:hypothetical protein
LEKALILKRGELIRFIYENLLQAWQVFYLYAKHNHASYRTKTNSLANDKGLLDLLIHQGGYQKELLSLAITGLFENEITYHNFSKTTTIKEYKIMPNPKVVKTILKSFPSICNEVIPYYMKPRIKVELNENYGEEVPDKILPLDMWKFYKNTFAERVYVDNVDRSNDTYREQIITIPKNELIGKLLEAAN